jgi:hypothetical protein
MGGFVGLGVVPTSLDPVELNFWCEILINGHFQNY